MRQAQIAAKEAFAALVKVFREGSHRAEPAAEGLLEQQAHQTRKPRIRNIAAGCTAGTEPVARKYLRFIRPAMGSHPSAPGGRLTESPLPPLLEVTHPEQKLNPEPNVER